jgi:hypothetical protein
MNVVMLFPVILKDLKPDNNSASPIGQTVRGQAPINFMMTV